MIVLEFIRLGGLFMRKLGVFLLLLFASFGLPAAAQDAVYLIRHGEKELTGAEPALTPEGRQRAADWAEMLQHVGFDSIITSDALRTRETGGIISEALGVDSYTYPRGNTATLLDALEFDHEEHTVLIVAHAETIPRILAGLGVSKEVTVDQSEFANLFVVLEPSTNDPVYLRFLMPSK